MALICYNRAKECDGCGYWFDYDPYEIEDDNIDDLFDKKRDKEVIENEYSENWKSKWKYLYYFELEKGSYAWRVWIWTYVCIIIW